MVATRLTRNQFTRKGTWVRIPPSPHKKGLREFFPKSFFVRPRSARSFGSPPVSAVGEASETLCGVILMQTVRNTHSVRLTTHGQTLTDTACKFRAVTGTCDACICKCCFSARVKQPSLSIPPLLAYIHSVWGLFVSSTACRHTRIPPKELRSAFFMV